MEAQQYVATSDCPDYLKKAEGRLEEECCRVKHYLDDDTEEKVTAVVQAEMIGKQMRMLTEMPNSGATRAAAPPPPPPPPAAAASSQASARRPQGWCRCWRTTSSATWLACTSCSRT